VAGFLVLTFSGYKMNADMGLLSAITLSVALLMDFLFLPALLLQFDRGSEP
jgi:predicted RND superfamily exporter protein